MEEEKKSGSKIEKVAKIIRVISVPPIMITALILILYFTRREYFRNVYEIIISIALLGFVPMMAYPVQSLIPSYKDKGRDGQRKLAFIATLIGYVAAFIWAIVVKLESGLFLVCSTYFFSVVILIICNALHFKASGHASSFTGPLLVLVYALGWKVIIPCVLVAGAIIWSSLKLKRHTMKQLLAGMGGCAISFGISLVLIYIIK